MKTTINALDPSQKFILEELTKGGADDLSLVYGPPGTGKSQLIVSLLFELAYAGKKVLFVSQNREALEVVVRKYKDLDRAMGLGDTDVTFLDFCLRLSDRSQRTIKYISSLRSRLFSKNIRRITSVEEINNDIPYALYYRELDREKNYDSVTDDSNGIGLDMLLANQLAFVKNEKIIKKILHRAEDINAKDVFGLLRDHKAKAENFKFFNNPSNELRLLNKVNDSAITIGKLHDVIYEIVDACRKNAALMEMSYIKENDIRNVLHFIAMLKEISKTYNVYEIKKDSVLFEDIFSELKRIRKNKEAIRSPLVDLGAIELPNTPIADKSVARYIKECPNIEALKRYKDDLDETVQCIVLGGYEKSSRDILQLASYAILGLDLKFDAIDSIVNLKEADGPTIAQFVEDIAMWSERAFYKKMFGEKPETLRALSEKEITNMAEYRDSLLTIADILEKTNLKYKDLRKIARSHISDGMILDGQKQTLLRISVGCLKAITGKLYEQSRKFTCEELCQFAKESTAEINTIIKIYSQSKDMANRAISEGIRIIDNNIENRALTKENDEAYERIGKYIIDSRNGWTKLPAISDKPKLIDAVVREVNFDDCFGFINADGLKLLRDKINDAAAEEMFSADFYKLAEGEKIRTWVDRIESLLAFEDRDVFGDFIVHNDFIMKLGKALGTINREYLKTYLEMDLDYDDFSEHIAYDLIRALYGNIPTNKCRSVKAKQYFNDFSKNLEKARRKMYEDAMSSLQLRCEDPAKHLAIQYEWRSAGSVMEKIRVNTQRIIDAYPVVMATPAEVAKYIAPNKDLFDFVVFDEASQLLPGQALPSLYRAKKAVIVGDPHQMPPTSSVMIGASNRFGRDDEMDDLEETSESILDKVKAMQIDSAYHLKVHYRSRYNILFEPSREAIYSQDDIRPIFEAKSVKMPLYIRDGLGEDQNTGFDTIIERINHYVGENKDATFCILFTRKSGVGSETEFKKYLESKGQSVDSILEKYSSEQLLISTVTNCQGISGDHTIMYIPAYASPKAMWFFKANAGAYKRLNVAITRQIESLDVIMGDDKEKWIRCCQELISNSSTAPDVLISAQLMEGLLLNAGRQIDEEYLEKLLGRNSDEIDSPLTEELYLKLNDYFAIKYPKEVRIWCEVGYKIRVPNEKTLNQNRYNVGYRIDIGIYSTKHKKFILGIEMDGATYHSGYEKEFSDAQRQEILETKGWSIYRIWSTNWLNDPEGEFNALVSVIEEELKKEPEPELSVAEIITAPLVNEDEGDDTVEEDGEGDSTILSNNNEESIPHGADAMVDYWQRLRDYLEKCFKLGKVINIKYVSSADSPELLERVLGLPYQKMIIKHITDESIEARFEDMPSPYKIYIKNIVAYKDE